MIFAVCPCEHSVLAAGWWSDHVSCSLDDCVAPVGQSHISYPCFEGEIVKGYPDRFIFAAHLLQGSDQMTCVGFDRVCDAVVTRGEPKVVQVGDNTFRDLAGIQSITKHHLKNNKLATPAVAKNTCRYNDTPSPGLMVCLLDVDVFNDQTIKETDPDRSIGFDC